MPRHSHANNLEPDVLHRVRGAPAWRMPFLAALSSCDKVELVVGADADLFHSLSIRQLGPSKG